MADKEPFGKKVKKVNVWPNLLTKNGGVCKTLKLSPFCELNYVEDYLQFIGNIDSDWNTINLDPQYWDSVIQIKIVNISTNDRLIGVRKIGSEINNTDIINKGYIIHTVKTNNRGQFQIYSDGFIDTLCYVIGKFELL